ncbi:hypothetical protein D6853_06515 [Butyrivibrio sp. X503]|nr:hypothetical protein D6853_06515 [Butyrivibrio sp. X503]
MTENERGDTNGETKRNTLLQAIYGRINRMDRKKVEMHLWLNWRMKNKPESMCRRSHLPILWR